MAQACPSLRVGGEDDLGGVAGGDHTVQGLDFSSSPLTLKGTEPGTLASSQVTPRMHEFCCGG